MGPALRLARIALQAEGLVLRGRAGAALSGLGLGLVAGLFGLAALGFAHVAVMAALLETMPLWGAALLLGAIDLVAAAGFGLVAQASMRRRMRRAASVRNSAMQALGPALASSLASGQGVRMALGAGLLGLLMSRLR